MIWADYQMSGILETIITRDDNTQIWNSHKKLDF